MANIEVFQATEHDIEFVLEAIINSDKSGSNYNSYCKIFDLTEDGLKNILIKILNESIPNSELNLSSFLIAKQNNTPMCTLSMWVEGVGFASNSQIKSSALSYFIGKEKWLEAQDKLRIVSEIELEREPGSVQIESLYVRNEFRGQRLLQKIINFGLNRDQIKKVYTVSKMQVISLKENKTAHKAFCNLGFEKKKSSQSKNQDILSVYNGSGKVLFEKDI
tara:strand:+ start:191 stop:850 length:660 start_codon:yes stop_codon:yes gene_type:complete